MAMHEKILILDFGAQYTQLIARRVRECGVYCEIHPCDVSDELRPRVRPGGHHPVRRTGFGLRRRDAARTAVRCSKLGVPVLGICYGMQTMAAQLGGKVDGGHVREFGYAEVRARGHSRCCTDIQDRVNSEGHGLLDVWMSHGDKVTALPPGFKVIASNAATPIAGMADETRKLYGVQFHPEVTHTLAGQGHSRALRARDLRPGRRLEHARLHRRGGRPDPLERRERRGDSRACPAGWTRRWPLR